jgi:hypothetical protein
VVALHGWIAGNGFPYEHSQGLPILGEFLECEDVEHRLRIAIPICSGYCVNFTALGKFMEFHGYLEPAFVPRSCKSVHSWACEFMKTNVCALWCRRPL